MPPTTTEAFPRVRGDATRLDPHALYDVAEPTVAVPVRTGRPPRVSAPGTHTVGAPAAVDRLNLILDQRDIAEDALRAAGRTRAGIFRRRRTKALTLRQHADRRTLGKLRHERHMEVLETVKAYLAVVCLVVLFLLVVAMAAVAFGILAGWMTWAPTRV